jgi:hypothetical protein
VLIRFVDAFGEGDIAGADAELRAYAGLAERLRRPYYRWYGLVLRATRAACDGDVSEASALATRAVELIRRYEEDSEQDYSVQRLMVAKARGEPEEADRAMLHAFAERYPELPLWTALASPTSTGSSAGVTTRGAATRCAPAS